MDNTEAIIKKNKDNKKFYIKVAKENSMLNLDKYNSVKIGKLGEEIATLYLKKNNYIIIDRNFYSKQGEIDIVAEDNNELVFIEVKSRTNLKYGEPVDAVDKIKQTRLIKTINYYLYLKHIKNTNIRVDIIEVYIEKERYKINHIKQVM